MRKSSSLDPYKQMVVDVIMNAIKSSQNVAKVINGEKAAYWWYTMLRSTHGIDDKNAVVEEEKKTLRWFINSKKPRSLYWYVNLLDWGTGDPDVVYRKIREVIYYNLKGVQK